MNSGIRVAIGISSICAFFLGFLGCKSTSYLNPRAEDAILIEAQFTTMGWEIRGGWFYQERNILIYRNGNAYQRILTNGIVENREYHFNRMYLMNLFEYLSERLTALPAKIGYFATDSDFGTITLHNGNEKISVSLEGGGYEAPKEQSHSFYEAMDKLLALLPDSNPIRNQSDSEE